MKLYFIVVCYNNEDLMRECLSSIRTQSSNKFGIIVVDNGSSDNSVEVIRKNFPDVKVLEQTENLGFAKANNIAVEEAFKDPVCEYVAFVNSDATLRPDWAETIISFAEKHPEGASFQTPTLDYFDHKVLDSRGITIDKYGSAKQLGHRDLYKQQGDTLVFGVNAAACIYTRKFLQSQPFDDFLDADLWMYLEDVDLAARATLMGWENWYVDGSFAYHMGSASSSKNPGFSVFYIYRNNYLMLIKNLPIFDLIFATFGVISTDIITIIKLLRHRNIVPLKSLVKGRIAAIRLIPLFLHKRRRLMRMREKSNRNFRKLMDSA